MGGSLKPDDRLSRYRIVGPLGAGGMGEVGNVFMYGNRLWDAVLIRNFR